MKHPDISPQNVFFRLCALRTKAAGLLNNRIFHYTACKFLTIGDLHKPLEIVISLCCNHSRQAGHFLFRCRTLAGLLKNTNLLLSCFRCGTSYQSNPATFRLMTHNAQHVVRSRDVTTGYQMKALMYGNSPTDLCPLVWRTIPRTRML